MPLHGQLRLEAVERDGSEAVERLDDERQELVAKFRENIAVQATRFEKQDDDETLAAALLSVAGQGNIRTTTLRAFTRDEMRTVIGKAP